MGEEGIVVTGPERGGVGEGSSALQDCCFGRSTLCILRSMYFLLKEDVSLCMGKGDDLFVQYLRFLLWACFWHGARLGTQAW